MTDWHLKRAVVCLQRLDESQEPVVKRKRVNNDDCDGKGKKKKRKMDEESEAAIVNHMDQTEFENTEEDNLDPSVEEFLQIADHVFDRTADLDLAEIMDNEDEDLSAVSSSDPVLDESLLGPIVVASDKLKSYGLTNKISCRKLVRLLKILHLCVTVPAAVLDSEGIESLSDIDDSVEQLIASLNASLAILNIMTSSKMPKVVYMEELVLRIVKTAKLYLQNFLYAQFDPRYRTDKEFVKGRSAKRNNWAAMTDGRALQMYTLLTQILALLSHLVEMQELTDAFVLEASSLAISPFLVENVHELQLVSLKLTYKIFSRYEKHQQLILEDILLLLAKLPCTTKNTRSYRNSHSEQIQRLTMLILHLFQSVVKCTKDVFKSKKIQVDDNVATELLSSYNKSLKTAQVFLSLFLSKCSARSEEDYRPLFENFVMDLLDIVHLPEWPSVEPILIILSSLLVKQFRTKSVDMPSRVAALGYLGLIAAQLRREDAGCRENSEVDEILSQHGFQHLDEVQKTARLQNLLLDYLSIKSEDESSSYFCRLFYIAQWCSDHAKSVSSSQIAGEMNGLSRETVSRARTGRCSSSSSNGPVRNESASQPVNGLSKETISKVQMALQALLTKKCPESGIMLMSSSGARAVARYLASRHSFVQKSDSKVLHTCADLSLMHILLIVGETTSALRSKAMKCLAGVIDADPQVLLMREVQDAIHCRCLDQSVSVRDAAVDLLGKSILQNEDLVDSYYGMLSERILDTGISVRKRVIAIFRYICLKFPMHSKVPNMCGQMLRRIGDEEGIKKLVTETFEGMWFTPLDENNIVAIRQRVDNIVGIVAACKQSFISDWMEQLICNVLKREKDKHHTLILKTCEIIVNGLVQVLPDLVEEFKDGSVPDCGRLVAAFTSLYIFCKLKPQFLVPHCSSLHIFLDPEYLPQMDSIVRHHAVHIVEMILPLLKNPDKQLMMQIENLLKKLILSLGTLIVQRSFSCLAVLVKNVTLNYSTVEFCFHNFFRVLLHYQIEHSKNPSSPILKANVPLLLRSLFIVGLLCEHFDCDEFGDHTDELLDRIFQTLFYFTSHESEDARMKALDAIGHMAVSHSDLMLQSHLRDLYTRHLSDASLSVKLCCQVLNNIRMYLIEEEARMMAADHHWNELHNQESLKEMADVQSGMAGTIIQVYLKLILELSFCPEVDVRLSALNLIATVLHQGLVHPCQCVPYLICLGSDNNSSISQKANHWLKEIHKKDQKFIQTKEALQGVRMSYQLQLKLHDSRAVTACDANPSAKPSGLNGFVYSLLRANRACRRVFLRALLRLFDDSQDTDLKELIFASDCIAGFGFQLQDEVLYLIHQLDSIVSNSGSNVLRLFTKMLYPDEEEQKKRDDDDDEEDLDSVLQIMPEDVTKFRKLCTKSQRFHLLLLLRRFLMSHYGISDRIIQQYSPTDGAKMYDKPLNVKNSSKFNSGSKVIDALLQQDISRRELAKVYLSFKDLMTAIYDVAEDENLNQAQTDKAIVGLGSAGSS